MQDLNVNLCENSSEPPIKADLKVMSLSTYLKGKREKKLLKHNRIFIVMQITLYQASLYPSSDAQVFAPFVAPPKGGCQGGQDGGPAAAVAPDFFAKSTREFAILGDSGFLQTFKPALLGD